MPKKITFNEFMQKATVIHGNKFQYMKQTYINIKTKMIIICATHGEFKQKPSDHLRSSGCPKCGRINSNIKRTKSFSQFIIEARLIHENKYEYFEQTYVNSKTKIKIRCPDHGIFSQIPFDHLKGKNCEKCGINIRQIKQTKPYSKFIEEVKLIHGDKYQYLEETYVNDSIKMTIICSIHGHFNQSPNNHLQGKGCPGCKESKGEKVIGKFLDFHNIKCIRQFKFPECKNILPLPFDFYLPDLNMCIEYDGIQHYKPIEKWGGNNYLVEIQKNDQIKSLYCFQNNIGLLRISYKDFKNIEIILKSKLGY